MLIWCLKTFAIALLLHGHILFAENTEHLFIILTKPQVIDHQNKFKKYKLLIILALSLISPDGGKSFQ